MSAWTRATAAGVSLVLLVLAQNLVGLQLNAFFLTLPGIDKLLHVFGYFLVFVGVNWLLQPVTAHPGRRAMQAAAAGLLLSVLDELAQSIAPGRSVEAADVVAGCAGLTLGWVTACRPPRRIALAASLIAVVVAGLVAYETRSRLLEFSLALRHERQHDFIEARTHYLRALESGLRTSAVYNGLSWVTIESGIGDPQEALAYARTAYEMDPGNPDIMDTYGWALHKSGQSQEALGYLRRAFAAKPDMFCIHYHLGEAYVATKQFALAEEHFHRQVAIRGTRESEMAARSLAGVRSTR